MPKDEEQLREARDAAYQHFMGEYLYWEMLSVADRFERHPWSRQQSQQDAEAVGKMLKYLRGVANDLYLAREAIKGQGG